MSKKSKSKPSKCTKKVPYESFSEAFEAAIIQSMQHGRPFEPHHCKYCKKYHVGSAQVDPTIKQYGSIRVLNERRIGSEASDKSP